MGLTHFDARIERGQLLLLGRGERGAREPCGTEQHVDLLLDRLEQSFYGSRACALEHAHLPNKEGRKGWGERGDGMG
jgi:hypothetical protein